MSKPPAKTEEIFYTIFHAQVLHFLYQNFCIFYNKIFAFLTPKLLHFLHQFLHFLQQNFCIFDTNFFCTNCLTPILLHHNFAFVALQFLRFLHHLFYTIFLHQNFCIFTPIFVNSKKFFFYKFFIMNSVIYTKF